ncbi:autotransporter outer membrane beta-barrel domain-containing protein [Pseudovibrio sp. Tun.PSC04-5.I4]|uniref:autotransporter outer membrane beta-barrel domain-containing protein n=1 Tax=Pseudovibrio sp. Tun.PSC04-5.I4 TaxID=1798213 RepID=UPI0013566973|nr:autotransporter outer membrane beta-barrel domain-containing protein [Pseudovibrio sp. Tun.PSC04-5.I4]
MDGTSPTLDTTHGSIGSLFGVDWSNPDGSLYGFYGGAGIGQVKVAVDNGHKTSTKNFYVGAYSLRDMHTGTYGFNVTGGLINLDSQRSVADSSVASGLSTAQADYKGWFIAPTLSYSKDHKLGENTLISKLSIGYQGLYTEGYSETGSNANVSVNARNIHQVTARGELALQKEKVFSSGTVLNFAPFMGAEGRIGVGADNITASLLGNTATFNPGDDKSVGRGFAGAKFTAAMSNTKSLFGKVEGSWDTNNTKSISANLGFSIVF